MARSPSDCIVHGLVHGLVPYRCRNRVKFSSPSPRAVPLYLSLVTGPVSPYTQFGPDTDPAAASDAHSHTQSNGPIARIAAWPWAASPIASWGGGIPHARACLARVMCVHKLPWSVPGRARVCPLAPISYTYLLHQPGYRVVCSIVVTS